MLLCFEHNSAGNGCPCIALQVTGPDVLPFNPEKQNLLMHVLHELHQGLGWGDQYFRSVCGITLWLCAAKPAFLLPLGSCCKVPASSRLC